MKSVLSLIIVAALAAGPEIAAASDKTDVMAVVHKWEDSFNKGDWTTMVAQCADQTSIIDDFAPHEWHGAGACQKWLDAFQAFTKKAEFTEMMVKVGQPKHLDVDGDSAYLVVTTTLTYKEGGKPRKLTGSTVTVSFQKGTSGWRINGWSWADGAGAVMPSKS